MPLSDFDFYFPYYDSSKMTTVSRVYADMAKSMATVLADFKLDPTGIKLSEKALDRATVVVHDGILGPDGATAAKAIAQLTIQTYLAELEDEGFRHRWELEHESS